MRAALFYWDGFYELFDALQLTSYESYDLFKMRNNLSTEKFWPKIRANPNRIQKKII